MFDDKPGIGIRPLPTGPQDRQPHPDPATPPPGCRASSSATPSRSASPSARPSRSVSSAPRCAGSRASASSDARPRSPKSKQQHGPSTTSPTSQYRRYRQLQTAAGVRALRFHDLRHTFGTQAIASGAHVMDVKEWMGHRHLSTTMRYVHHQPRHEAAARLGRHFTGAASELDALLGDPGDLEIGPPG